MFGFAALLCAVGLLLGYIEGKEIADSTITCMLLLVIVNRLNLIKNKLG